MSQYNLLKTIPFNSLTSWSIKTLLGAVFAYNKDYKLVSIKNFLTRNKTPIEIKDDESYKRVTIKLYNGGIFLRDVEVGKNIGTKKQFVIKQGQFLLSKIDARNGAFGVVTQELNDGIITGNFWTFDVDYSIVDPYFLSLVTTTKEFNSFCNNASTGTTNRHYLQEEAFLAQKIPLPKLEKQKELVNQYQKMIDDANNYEKQANELDQSIEIYLYDKLAINNKTHTEKKKNAQLKFINSSCLYSWSVQHLVNSKFGLLNSVKFNNVKLTEVVLINPTTSFIKINPELEISFIPMENISDEYLGVKKHNIGQVSLSRGYTKFLEGDLIWARITPCMQNGKSAIATDLINGLGYGSTEYHVIRKMNDEINLTYLWHILQLPSVLNYAKKYFKGSAGQQRVPKEFLEDLSMPLPPLDIQNEIAENITSIKNKIKKLKQQAEQNKIDAITNFEKAIFHHENH